MSDSEAQYEEEEEWEEEDEEEEEEGVEHESESWQNKINDATGNSEMNRSTTPLRPDDGLVGRVKEQEFKMEKMKLQFKAGTAAMNASGKLAKMAGNSRNKKAAAAKAESDRLAKIRAQKQKEIDSMKTNFPEINSARTHKGELPPGEDAYSLHEKDIVTELNLVRANPAQYAKLMAMVFLIGHPFLPQSMGKVNHSRLKEFLATTTTDVADLSSALGSLEDAENKEVQVLKNEWAMEDNDKNKKKKGAAAAKGKGKDEKAVEEAAAAAAQEAERDEAIQAIVIKNSEQRTKLESQISEATSKRDKAALGLKHMDHCMRKLDSLGPMPPIYYNRGLSLATRDLCAASTATSPTNSATGAATAASVERYCMRYGSLVRDDIATDAPTNAPPGFNPEASSQSSIAHLDSNAFQKTKGQKADDLVFVMHRGNELVRQTVMEMILCFDDPKKMARAKMLHPTPCFVGSGWRRDSTGTSVSCLLFSNCFEELEAIAIREHMSLQDIRRVLSQATALTSKTVLKLRSPQCSIVSPTAHPVVCANSIVVTIRCPLSLNISAALHSEREVVPKAPSSVGGEIFIQRSATDCTLVEIHVLLPFKAHFGLAIYSREENAASGLPDGISTLATLGYNLLGRIRLHGDSWHIQNCGAAAGCPKTFPLTTSNFAERQAFLVRPLEGTLTRDQNYTFEIIIPKTKYLTHELDRISSNLATATAIASGSKEKAEALQAVATQKAEAFTEKEKEKDEKMPQLAQELAALTKDQGKKRGKDLDKNKLLIIEVETQMKQFDDVLAELKQEQEEAEEKIILHRRSTRQASAQRRRFLSEQTQLAVAADRSQPLMVEVSLEERRAKLEPIDDDFTKYATTVRAPKGGQVCLFIGGVSTLTWVVA